MKKLIKNPLTLLILLSIPILLGCSVSLVCIEGSGNITTENRDVEGFHSIELNGQGNLYITQSNQSSLAVETDDNLLPEIETEVKNGELIITQKNAGCLTPTNSINYWVSMNDVNDLVINGSGNIYGDTTIETTSLHLELNGSGNIELDLFVNELDTGLSGSGKVVYTGKASTHNFSISGSGNLKGFGLTTNKSVIDVSGSGKTEVTANEELDVTISGSGNVFYKGIPKINQEISGSGTLESAE